MHQLPDDIKDEFLQRNVVDTETDARFSNVSPDPDQEWLMLHERKKKEWWEEDAEWWRKNWRE